MIFPLIWDKDEKTKDYCLEMCVLSLLFRLIC